MADADDQDNRNDIVITVSPDEVGIFTQLAGYGFVLHVPSALSVRELLEKHLHLDPTYIENSINTLLHDGRPVDNVDVYRIYQSSTLALSAALPGVFGAAFRKEGAYAALRPTQEVICKSDSPSDCLIEISVKLFNLTAREISPFLLKRGMLMKTENIESFFNTRRKAGMPDPLECTINGFPIMVNSIADHIPSKTDLIRIRVTSLTE